MSTGQRTGTNAMTELDDEKMRNDSILCSREKAENLPAQSLGGKSVQIDKNNDNPAYQHPSSQNERVLGAKAPAEKSAKQSPTTDKPEKAYAREQVDRPGFDLGGSTGENHAGKGIGLGTDAREGRESWDLPR